MVKFPLPPLGVLVYALKANTRFGRQFVIKHLSLLHGRPVLHKYFLNNPFTLEQRQQSVHTLCLLERLRPLSPSGSYPMVFVDLMIVLVQNNLAGWMFRFGSGQCISWVVIFVDGHR